MGQLRAVLSTPTRVSSGRADERPSDGHRSRPAMRPPVRRALTLRTLQGKPGASDLKRIDPRQRLRKLLNAPNSSHAATAAALVIIGTIIVSVFNFFLTTVPRFDDSDSLWAVEVACGAIFSFELLLRTYVATLDLRTMMLLEPMYWVDVLTIIPFYIDIFPGASR